MRRIVALCAVASVACGDNKHVDAAAEAPSPPACSPVPGTNVVLRQAAITQGSTVLVTGPVGDPRQFVVEQEGRIRILDGSNYQPAPDAFLDITADNNGPVLFVGELGLLGLAFHPQYETNHQFFVSYTAYSTPGDPSPYVTAVSRYTTKVGDPSHADLASAQIVLAIQHPFGNHNGGMIEFGSDGYLYWGTGDGGGENDQLHTGQDPTSLLGKVLRLDVDHPANGKPYGIPSDNPYANGGGAPEIYMIGVRNPWRWSFDRGTGDMWIGDVGQDTVEEVDRIRAGSQVGANLGWSMYEGSDCFHAPCDTTGQTLPVLARLHSDAWCAVIGGQVYRGACYPDLVGAYVFTDYCAHTLELARTQSDGTVLDSEPASVTTLNLDGTTATGVPSTPSGLHADGTGELWLSTVTCCNSTLNGAIYHVEATP